MADAQVLERPAETATGVPKCQAMIPVFLDPDDAVPLLMQCPEDAEGLFEGWCACGHVRRAWLCAPHAELLGETGCRACAEDEAYPHDCPLTAAPVTGRGDGRG